MICVFCRRPLKVATVYLGEYAAGPKCARDHGVMPLAVKRAGIFRPGPAYKRTATRQELAQLDLFEGVA